MDRRPVKKFSKITIIIMSDKTQKMDHANIAQAPLPIQKLYQVAMESRDEVLAELKLEQMCVEQYIEECM